MRVVRLVAISFLLATVAFGKGGGVGFWLEGRVSDVSVSGEHIHFRLTGRFWMSQYPDRSPQPQRIELASTQGISVTVTQAKPFYAMTTDWAGGALRESGELLKILQTAARRGSPVKLEMLNSKLEFPSSLSVSVTDAAVIRATDSDLR